MSITKTSYWYFIAPIKSLDLLNAKQKSSSSLHCIVLEKLTAQSGQQKYTISFFTFHKTLHWKEPKLIALYSEHKYPSYDNQSSYKNHGFRKYLKKKVEKSPFFTIFGHSSPNFSLFIRLHWGSIGERSIKKRTHMLKINQNLKLKYFCKQ